MTFTSEKKTTLFYILAATILVLVLWFFYFNNKKVKATSDLVEHTQDILRMSDAVLLDVLNIETSARGYLLSGNEVFLAPYTEGVSKIDNNLVLLAVLTQDNVSQQERIVLLQKTVHERLILTKNIIEVKKLNELTETDKIKIIEQGNVLSDKIRAIINDINAEEFDLLKKRRKDSDNSYKNANLLFLWLLILLLAIIALVVVIIRNQKLRNQELKASNAAQKLLEKDLTEYKLFFNQSTDYKCVCTLEGYFELINDSLVQDLGYSKGELLANKFLDYIHPDDVAETLKEIENLAKGKNLLNFVNRYRKIDGSYLSIEWKANYNTTAYKIYTVGRDVTQKKRTENELIEAKIFAEAAKELAEVAKNKAEDATKIAKEAVKAKQQFLSNMSHEIRTPMNAIIGFTKVVLKTDLSAKQQEYLNAIRISGDTLIVLINDILDLAKVDAGKMTFEKKPFKLAAALSAMLHLFETKIEEKNLTLIREYDDKIPEFLVGDSVRLNQIMVNLVGNAVKFTPKGQITVSVLMIGENEDHVTLEFAVKDTGIGISDNKMTTVFESFQQASSDTTRLFGGTGLGLAIVKQLVEAQGGTIAVKSKITEGSVFSVLLDFEKTQALAEVKTVAVEMNSDAKNIKILVVEDMKLNQLLMRTILDDFGFEHDIADNGQIAIEKLKNTPYDIILMDLQMPEMNGFEATEYIRNTLKLTVPIIALTADVTTVDVEKCRAVGMNDYVSKPLDERILYAKIMDLVKKI
jgi:PAS domain S-box-containing protein